MNGSIWSKEDVSALFDLAEQGYCKEEIAEKLNRTVESVTLKAKKVHCIIYKKKDGSYVPRKWTEQDDMMLEELWNDYKVNKSKMEKLLKRSWKAISCRAVDLGLGNRDSNLEYLTIYDICNQMKVSFDIVVRWTKNGLKYKKNKAGRTKYLIDPKDLLAYLEQHKSSFDASKLDKYLFIPEPDWLKEKRLEDALIHLDRAQYEYTNEEDKIIQSMFMKNKSDEYIANYLHRTTSAIKTRRMTLGLVKSSYNPYEIEILKKYSDYKTIYELAQMLPIRTANGIMTKCKSLNLPYHISKDKCRKE